MHLTSVYVTSVNRTVLFYGNHVCIFVCIFVFVFCVCIFIVLFLFFLFYYYSVCLLWRMNVSITTSTLWGNTAYEVKWWRFVALFE